MPALKGDKPLLNDRGGDRKEDRRDNRAGGCAHPGADARRMHASIVVCRMLEFVDKRSAGARGQHQHYPERETQRNRFQQLRGHAASILASSPKSCQPPKGWPIRDVRPSEAMAGKTAWV